MIDNIIRLFQIGKELGLTKREISSLFLFKNPRHRTLSMILFIFLTVLTITTLSILIAYSFIQVERDTYPTGSKYSTVKIKDFRLKREKK